jgi:hypothetical protein
VIPSFDELDRQASELNVGVEIPRKRGATEVAERQEELHLAVANEIVEQEELDVAAEVAEQLEEVGVER